MATSPEKPAAARKAVAKAPAGKPAPATAAAKKAAAATTPAKTAVPAKATAKKATPGKAPTKKAAPGRAPAKKAAPAKAATPAKKATPGKKAPARAASSPPAAKLAAGKTAGKTTARKAPAKSAARRPRGAAPSGSKPAAQKASAVKATGTAVPVKTTVPKSKPAGEQKPTSAKTKPALPETIARKAVQKAASAARSRFFAKAQKRARKLLRSHDDLMRLVKKANREGRRLTSGPLAALAGDVTALLRLIRAYAKGRYRDVSFESMVLIVGAILYVVSPIDVIPDAIPGVGLLDDAVVLSFVLRLVREEIDDFLEWEQQTGRGPKDG